MGSIVTIILMAALTFGVCFLIDKGFHGIFRNKKQHKSGKAVHLNKKYGVAGILLTVLGIAAILTGLGTSKILFFGGIVVMLLGIAFLVYYLTFGIYYDGDTFLLSTFGNKDQVYHYRDIKCQQLYQTAGGVVIELFMTDGRSVSLQASMEGYADFLDWAFHGWCRQKMVDSETCTFHKPEESCWFPPLEAE